MLMNVVRICMFPLAAYVMGTVNVGVHQWQYWAIMVIMFVSVILASINTAQHSVQRICRWAREK